MLALVANIVAGIVLMPIIVGHIGLNGLGIWVLANTLVGYMGLLDVGLGPTLVRKSAELLARDAKDELEQTTGITFTIYTAIGVAAGLGTVLFSDELAAFFNVPREGARDLHIAMLILGLQIALSFPMSIWQSLLGGLQAFHIRNIVAIASALVKVIGTIVLLELGYGILGLIAIGLLVSCLGWLVSAVAVKRRIPFLKVGLRRFRFAEARHIAHFSSIMLLGTVSWKISSESARVIIGLFMPIAAVAVYEIGLVISLYSKNLFYMTSILIPSAAHLDAVGDQQAVRDVYLKGSKYLFAIYLGLATALYMLASPLISAWMGPGFEDSVLVLSILLVGNVFQSQNMVGYHILIGVNRLGALTAMLVAYPIVSVGLSILLIRDYGLVGVAVGTTLSVLLVETYFLSRLVKIFDVPWKAYVSSCIAPALLPAAAAGFAMHFAGRGHNSGLAYLVLSCCTFSAVWIVLFVSTGMKADERSTIKERIGHFVRRERPTQ